MKIKLNPWDEFVAYGVAVAMLLTLAIVFGSCTRTIYIPVENNTQHSDTHYRALWRTDTVIDRDTVLTFVHGDSVRQEVTRWRWRNREQHDTIYRDRVDSVYLEKPIPVEVIKEMAKPVPWWKTALMWLGILALLGAGITVYLCVKKGKI